LSIGGVSCCWVFGNAQGYSVTVRPQSARDARSAPAGGSGMAEACGHGKGRADIGFQVGPVFL